MGFCVGQARVKAALGTAPGGSLRASSVDQLGSAGPGAFLEIADPWEMAGSGFIFI